MVYFFSAAVHPVVNGEERTHKKSLKTLHEKNIIHETANCTEKNKNPTNRRSSSNSSVEPEVIIKAKVETVEKICENYFMCAHKTVRVPVYFGVNGEKPC